MLCSKVYKWDVSVLIKLKQKKIKWKRHCMTESIYLIFFFLMTIYFCTKGCSHSIKRGES